MAKWGPTYVKGAFVSRYIISREDAQGFPDLPINPEAADSGL